MAGRSLAGMVSLIGLLVSSAASPAQTLLDHPESAAFDAARNRYLVSNWGDGAIVVIDSNHVESYFSTELTCAGGLEIRDNVLYVVAKAEPYIGVVAFDVATAEIIQYIPIPASIPTDICIGPQENLYVVDCAADLIYKVYPASESYSVFYDFGSGMPYAIAFDESANRLLTVMQEVAGYPMRAISLADSSMTFVRNTYFPCVDGIARDIEGYTYVTNCSTNSVYKYNADFQHPPALVSSGHNGPLMISIRSVDAGHGILAVPNWAGDSVDFVPLTYLSSVDRGENLDPEASRRTLRLAPNPTSGRLHISHHLDTACIRSPGSLAVYDLGGRLVKEIWSGDFASIPRQFVWHGRSAAGHAVAAGRYILRLRAGGITIGTSQITVSR